MRPVRTADANTTLTLDGGTAENELPAQRTMLYDPTRGETAQDGRPGFVTTWAPDEFEQRRLDAGALVELIVWGSGHPPVTVRVTDGVMPERELISRGHVDRALGMLAGALYKCVAEGLQQIEKEYDVEIVSPHAATDADAAESAGMPNPAAFADMWSEAVRAAGLEAATVAGKAAAAEAELRRDLDAVGDAPEPVVVDCIKCRHPIALMPEDVPAAGPVCDECTPPAPAGPSCSRCGQPAGMGDLCTDCRGDMAADGEEAEQAEREAEADGDA